MAASKIDLDRGVVIRKHPTGVEVFEYKDDPGVYLNTFGKVVHDDLAKEAGYDTGKQAKAKLRKERMAEALARIEAELADGDGEAGDRKVVNERDGFKVVDIGLGRFIIEDPDGGNLTKQPLTKQEVEVVFGKLVPEKAPDTRRKLDPEKAPVPQGISKEDLATVPPGQEAEADARKRLDEAGASDDDDGGPEGGVPKPKGPVKSDRELRRDLDEAGAKNSPDLDPSPGVRRKEDLVVSAQTPPQTPGRRVAAPRAANGPDPFAGLKDDVFKQK